jgi:PIN domain nuclease of toxin-antitoxin system
MNLLLDTHTFLWLVEGMTLVSADAKFAPYSVPILW